MIRRLIWGILGLAAILASVVLIRTALFTSRQMPVGPQRGILIDKEQIADHLAKAIQLRTISHGPVSPVEEEAFKNLHRFFARSYPKVHSTLKRETVSGSSLLYTWEGADPNLKPILLMAHMDVVPVAAGTEGDWTHPPFSGEIADGFIWGRGAMDDKVGVMSILEAVEILIAEGFRPSRTVYLAFGHDEEVGGFKGAAKIAALLRARGVELEFTLDEGFAITEGILPGVVAPVAMIGVAEKGYLSLELTVESPGGHSSMPPKHTAVGALSTAIHRLERNPFPAGIKGATRQLFEFVGPEMPFSKKMVFANLWLFGRLAERRLAASPSTNALIRTTVAATMVGGSDKENKLPTKAWAIVNVRIMPGESIDSVTEYVQRTINNPKVEIRTLEHAAEPSPVSDAGSASFKVIQRTIHEIFPDVVVAPSLTVGGTDSKHYVSLSDAAYRFMPLRLKPIDLHRYHGTNERVAVDNLAEAVRFYARLIRNASYIHK